MAAATVSIGRLRRSLEPWLSGLRLGVRPVHEGLLCAVLVGPLRLPSPYVADIARGLGEEFGRSFWAREHRLLRFLASPKFLLGRIKAAYRRLLDHLLPGAGWVFLFADLSDLSKPYARRMPGLDWVRDGSDHPPPGEMKRIVRGYWLNEVYVELGPGRMAPVVFDLYSLRSGETLSQTRMLLRGMEEAFELVGPRGVWVADRGFDDRELLGALLSRGRHFVIRVQVGSNARHLLLEPGGPPATVEAILRHLPLRESLYSDRELRRTGKLGWVKVRLPDFPDPVLTLVVCLAHGHDEPLAVLTTLPVPDVAAARRVVAAYFRRWSGAEDPIRFLKQTFDLEKFLVSFPRAMRAWVFLIGVALGLYSLLLAPRSVGRALAGTVESFSDDVTFFGYRLARALADLLQALPARLYRRLLLTSGP
jgi:hypothetical protein